jgi:hypothetical protein
MSKALRRIIFISNSITPRRDGGGGSVVVYRHLKRFKDAGHQVVVVILYGNLPPDLQVSDEFEYIQLRKKPWYPPLRKKTPLLSSLRIDFTLKSLNKQLKISCNDVVLGILCEVSNLLAVKIKERFEVPFFLLYHDDTIFNRYALQNILNAALIGEILTKAAYIFPVSDPLTDLLKDSGIANTETLYPIPEGYSGPFTRTGTALPGSPQLLVSGMLEPIHFPTLKKISRAVDKQNGKFYCVADLPSGQRTALTAGEKIIVRPRFPTNAGLFNFIREKITILLVFYSFDLQHEPRMLTSFPSKFVEYCHLRTPVLIIAPPDSSLGKWAKKNKWLGYLDNDDPDVIAENLEKFNDPDYRECCLRQLRRLTAGEFNPSVIHQQLAKHILS